MTIKNRHPVRDKDAETYLATLRDAFGMDRFDGPIETGDSSEGPVLIAGGRIVAVRIGGTFLPTIAGLLLQPPTRGWVTVDMGAVPHVTNGADAMAPGIVDADPDLEAGDWSWIRDVENEQPLAVGRALVGGPEMVDAGEGKAVENLHHVGDRVFELDL